MTRHDPVDPTDDDGVAVAVHGLRKTFGATEVLRGVDLTVLRGEVVALLGPNGAGKTTTVEVLEGLLPRTAGDVRVLGADPGRGDPAWRARVGIVLQAWRDHERWTIGELLGHVAAHYPPYATPGRPRPRPVEEVATLVGLADRTHELVGTLSGGQRRRLDVAIALVGNPEVLFLDEPTTGFDPAARREFHELVRRMAGDDTAVLLTTHDLDEAERLADRIVILHEGRVLAVGRPSQLAERLAVRTEVRWRQEGREHRRTVDDSTAFLRDLLSRHGAAVQDVEVVRPDLESVYLGLVGTRGDEVGAPGRHEGGAT